MLRGGVVQLVRASVLEYTCLPSGPYDPARPGGVLAMSSRYPFLQVQVNQRPTSESTKMTRKKRFQLTMQIITGFPSSSTQHRLLTLAKKLKNNFITLHIVHSFKFVPNVYLSSLPQRFQRNHPPRTQSKSPRGHTAPSQPPPTARPDSRVPTRVRLRGQCQ